MKNLTIKKREEGFTIIEVMIVLAIAGLIMLIVFLAVPALQRNSRNTQRNNDAARVSAAINECTANQNGTLTSCDSSAELGNYIDFAQNQQLTNSFQTTPGVNAFQFQTGTQCNPAGTGTVAQGGTRAFTILYLLETQGGTQQRCIAG